MSCQSRAVAAATALALCSSASYAEENAWGFELTPYLWAAGIDADVRVRGREADVDLKFDDLIDRVDMGGSLLGIGYYNHFVTWTQLDYLSTDSNELDTDEQPAGGRARFQSDMFIGTLAFGYRFGDPNGRRNLDLMLGARYLDMESKLDLNAGRFKRNRDYLDGVVIARPSFRISERWRFNPTFSIGAGDSELTWELQPQIQFNINDNLGLRFGYRNLYYKLESDNEQNEFDGSYKGLILGLGGTFGNRPYYMAKKTPEPAPQPMAAATPPPAPAVAPQPPGDTDGDGVADHIDKCPSTAAGVTVDPIGCGFNTTLAVTFDTNSATLKPESNAELDRLVEVFKNTSTVAGYVEGYTDSTGSAEHNLKLSRERAQAVADYLISHGISQDRVYTKGYGERNPVADNTTAEGRAQNRRVILRRVDADR